MKKIKNKSIEIRALVDKNLLKSYNIPEEWSKQFQDPITFYKNFNIYQNVRILNQIDFSLIVSDKGAILFLNKDGDIDYSQCIIDNHQPYISWT